MSRSRPLLLCLALAVAGVPARADDAVGLREAFPPGYQYHVSTRVEATGTLTLLPDKGQAAPRRLAVTGDSASDYDERVLATAADGEVGKTLRVYRRCDLHRKVGEQRQESTVRPEVRRLVLLRQNGVGAPFSTDGPLTWYEIDLVRTEVFTPALAGLLPDQPVRPGDRWPARQAALHELTQQRIEEGAVECRFDQVTALDRRRYARVAFAGTVRGTNEDGPIRQQLDGYLFFDLESQHVSYLYLKGVNFLLDKDGKEVGRVEGQFVLTRQANTAARELTDAALRGVVVEPNADNTRLLYDNPELGVRFLHPRRWHVAGVRGGQVGLDSADGSGVLLTVEPLARVPTGAAFLNESRGYLQGQKAKVQRIDPPRRLQAAPRELEQFGLEAEVMGQRVQMEYYVARQAGGGATLAARLLPTELDALRKEVEGIARSLVITRRIEPGDRR
jgi:hypothetical protein